ncbi:hypothetical protein COY95_04395 [Candidatus Woesearchaeota archaeon CG_4_10_14_0_8_um_filter_47_5]|nr:MAG: hypothetical protein COY95_04395 [Candidatus Woesearchaeota archaeon CG_4_10_14_0_8_um_filter_47_5]
MWFWRYINVWEAFGRRRWRRKSVYIQEYKGEAITKGTAKTTAAVAEIFKYNKVPWLFMIVAMLISGLVSGYFLTVGYERLFDFLDKRMKREPIIRIKGIHLHHSMYGLAAIIGSFFAENLFLLALGLGIIVRHSQDEGTLVFIDWE